ncbi:histidine--tRNA ligase [Patescibacteria group bacterium]|jgi:histidyl-tRNA synthetase|nr:histidine--tRNA ligase [Patescibacteria group bacterium]
MSENTSGPLSTEPVRGVRDFLPRDHARFSYILETMRATAERFGFLEYSASILEPTELYTNKTSEEIVREQTYTFLDRGERSLTLRPEMTPSVARLIAGHRREFPMPQKWYSIPACYRYERPQRGRLREFWQLNCDIFGATGIYGDAEILLLAHGIMRAFGATDEQFTIKINHRGVLRELLNAVAREAQIELAQEDHAALLRVMDRKDKLSTQEYAHAIAEVIGAERSEALLAHHTDERIAKLLPTLPAFKEFTTLQQLMEHLGLGNVKHDPSLVRGFDYYTGMVFEVFDTAPENSRSIFGGGRYDNLTELFGGEPVSGVGFGMGEPSIQNFLETHDLVPTYVSPTELFLVTIGPAARTHAFALAAELREADVATSVNLIDRSVGEQLKYASSLDIPFALVIGEDEIASGTYPLKHLKSQSEQPVVRANIPDALFSFGMEREES